MEFSGSHRISAPRAAVWAALDDPELMKACIPGCTGLERTGDESFDGSADAKIGPVRAAFTGSVTRTEAVAPERFTLLADGDAGPSGSGQGRADVTLAEDGDGTVVSYDAQVEVAGKIGQLGSRLVTGFARKNAESFFEALATRLSAGYAAAPVIEAPAAETPEPAPLGQPPLAEAPPLVHEEPADGQTATIDAPPLAFGSAPIAPTAVPAVPDPVAIAAEEMASPGSSSASAVTRIMLVAAIVVVVGCLVYYILWQQTPV